MPEDSLTLGLHVILIATGLCTIITVIYGAGKVTGGNSAIMKMLVKSQEEIKENHNKLTLTFDKHIIHDETNFGIVNKELTDIKVSIAHAWPKSN